MERQRNYRGKSNYQMNQCAELDSEKKRKDSDERGQIEIGLPEVASAVNVFEEALKQKVQELHQLNEELKRQKNFVISVMELIPSYVFVVDETSGDVTFSNRCTVNNDDFPCITEVLGLHRPNSCKACTVGAKNCKTLHYIGKNGESEIKTESETGQTKWYQLAKRKMDNELNGINTNATIYSLTDITSLKQNEIHLVKKEEVISNALKEKALLLQEVHHRVKNNLQIIYGLLSLQSNESESVDFKLHITEIQSRIFSISLIHEELYQSENFLTIDVGSYCRKLCNTIGAIAHYNQGVNFIYRLQDGVKINIERATPLGLFVNEVVSNAFKHAFKTGKEGTITFELQDNDELLELHIKDDGPGLSHGAEQFFNSTSLGSRLIKGLAQQLRGRIEVDGSNGFSIKISLPSIKKMKLKSTATLK